MIPVTDIWRVGKEQAAKMKSLHIVTAKDLRDCPDHKLMKVFNTVVTMRTVYELRGIHCNELVIDPPLKRAV